MSHLLLPLPLPLLLLQVAEGSKSSMTERIRQLEGFLKDARK